MSKFDKLKLGPHGVFWSDAQRLLDATVVIRERLDAATIHSAIRSETPVAAMEAAQSRFQRADFDGLESPFPDEWKHVLDGLEIPNDSERIAHYCAIRESQLNAQAHLFAEAGRWGKPDATPEETLIGYAKNGCFDAIDLNNLRGMGEDFFIRFGAAVQAGKKARGEERPALDWSVVDKLEMFLVDNWCGDSGDSPLQNEICEIPLCLCTDTALAHMCELGGVIPPLRTSAGNLVDVVRKRAERLGLKRCSDRAVRRIDCKLPFRDGDDGFLKPAKARSASG